MAELNAGFQTWQEERYVILLFLLLLRGGEFYMTVALAVPPLSVKNRDVRLISHVRLTEGIR